MKKILSIALVSLLACGALLAGCGGEKKADPCCGRQNQSCLRLRQLCQRRRLFYGA